MSTATYPLDGPFDLSLTLRPLVRGTGDPTIRLTRGRAWRATRTSAGPATIALTQGADSLTAEAWGPGGDVALAAVPRLLGIDTHRPPIDPPHPLLDGLARRFAGVRLTRTEAVLEALVPAILEQKITGDEARRTWRRLVATHGEPAPGPPDLRLRLPPAPETLAALPYYAYHPLGLERRRAELIRRVAARAAWFEAIVDLPLPDAHARLTAVPGIGPWTAAEVAVRALGDPDAVSVGDFHLKNLVAFSLAGEPRADDARMLELLEPWRGQRAWVVRLLELGGAAPPRRGPRLSSRRIDAI